MLERLKQKVIRLFYPFKSLRKVHRGPVKGYYYYVSPGMGFSYAWGRENMHLSWFDNHVKSGMCIYDVGANRGQMALYFARKVGNSGMVVSFEPVPDIYEILSANVKVNHLDHVKTYCSAAANTDGHLTFDFNPMYSTQGKLLDCEPQYKVSEAKEFKVEAVKLDSIVNSGVRAPDLIKIDVEGGAALVLKGARQLIEKNRPIIYCELHGPEEKAAIKELASVYQYQITDIKGNQIADFDRSEEQVMCCLPKSI